MIGQYYCAVCRLRPCPGGADNRSVFISVPCADCAHAQVVTSLMLMFCRSSLFSYASAADGVSASLDGRDHSGRDE